MGTRSAWTEERRERQREVIRCWRPWEQSTGPRTKEGKERSSKNAKRSDDLIEAEAYLQLLRMRALRYSAVLGGPPLSAARLKEVTDKIDELEGMIDPDGDLAQFLADSGEIDDDLM